MESQLFQTHVPLRPIPTYAESCRPHQFQPMPAWNTIYQFKKMEEGNAAEQYLSFLTHRHQICALGECHFGQTKPQREKVLNNLSQELDKRKKALPLTSRIVLFPTEKTIVDCRPTMNFLVAAKSKESNSNANKISTPIILPCNKPFQTNNTYGRKIFPCLHCRYTTDRRNNLKRHMLTMHQTCSKVLECCGILFATKASLREHAAIFHYHGYTCFYCGRRFCRKALLKRHLSVHNGQKDFVCSICNYATSHKSNLERHQRVHCRLEDEKSGNDSDGKADTASPYCDKWIAVNFSERKQAKYDDAVSSSDESEEINVD
ncbi:hypothetical protein CHS0354_027278 [Potamilus streckersoni]|uniref:C2H2-type domain-containing protein n=1 Tax=Potamilus streckersoni TaxID=2493646 RepID=A0AAE0T8Z6_9BIVA|nr:hypothetical protein CHS0354_027278 [Potamilus streckersoni]